MAPNKSIYVHYNDELTQRFDLTGPRSVRSVVQEFCQRHHGGAAYQYTLTTEEGKPVSFDTDLEAAAAAGDDFFLSRRSIVLTVRLPGGKAAVADCAALGAKVDATFGALLPLLGAQHDEVKEALQAGGLAWREDGAPLPDSAPVAERWSPAAKYALEALAPAADDVAEPPPAVAAEVEKYSEELKLLQKYLGMAEEALAKGAYARAIEIYSKLQGAVPGETQSAQGLAVAYLKARQFPKAIKAFEHLFELVEPSTDAEYLQVVCEYSEALRGVGRNEKAVTILADALRQIGNSSTPIAQDLKTHLAYSYYGLEDDKGLQLAATLWTAVLNDTEQKHVGAMLGYVKLLKIHDPPTCLRGLLNVLVANSSNKEVRAAFGDAMRDIPDSIALLDKVMPLKDAPAAASAYAFVGLVMKEQGAIKQAVHFYKRALKRSPDSACYVLNLTHTMDLACNYWESLAEVVAFCKKHAKMKVSAGGHSVTCAEVAAELDAAVTARSNELFLSGDAAKKWAATGKVVRWQGDGAFLGKRDDPTQSSRATNGTTTAEERAKCPYGEAELDLLALWFAAVKKLFSLGCLEPLARLCVLLDPLRRDKGLHTTLIRNEHAYFCTVAQLMQYIDLPIARSKDVVYVCGDSHSLTPSWRTLDVAGKTCLLQNALVTGLKCWHLRDESNFYPKHQFLNVTAGIPKGATVLMMFGEIDCREGILMAVEKGRYADVQEGMDRAVEIYLQTLRKLRAEKGWRILVHPALPVLDVTRFLVCQFNQTLKAAVAKAKVKDLLYLDFHEKMLTDDKKALLPQYELDGTHANPAYLSLVQEAVDAVLK